MNIFRWIEQIFSSKPQPFIPIDILITIFQYLDGASLGHALYVCRLWSKSIQENRSCIPFPYNFYTSPILIKSDDIIVIHKRKKESINVEEAVKEFWKPGTILCKLIIVSSIESYETVKNLVENMTESRPMKVKKLKIISNYSNSFNLLDCDLGFGGKFFQEMVDTEKLSVRDRVSISFNDDYQDLGEPERGIRINQHLSINIRNGNAYSLIRNNFGIYQDTFIQELNVQSIFVCNTPYKVVSGCLFSYLDTSSTEQLVDFLCHWSTPIQMKKTFWLCIFGEKYTNLMRILINKFNYVDGPRRFPQQTTLYFPVSKRVIQESRRYIKDVLHLVPIRSRYFPTISNKYEVKHEDGWILIIILQSLPISCIKLKTFKGSVSRK